MTKQVIPAANFGNVYDATYGIRVMYNDNDIWSEPVTFKTSAAKGWVAIRQYRDDMQTKTAEFLNTYIRRYRCIGLKNRASQDAALFVFGAEGQSNGVWNGREYPMDGSTGRALKTTMMEYCHFVYCANYIYRVCFKYDGTVAAKIHRMALPADMNATLETWEDPR